MTKSSIRNEVLAARDGLNPMIKDMLSNTIMDNIIQLNIFENSKMVFLYSSIRNEVDTVELIEYCLRCGKKVALPCSYVSQGVPKMDFYYINSRTDLVPGYMGILEPDRRKTSVKKATDMPDSIIIPGVAFDYKMNRVGYGAGFYDNYLHENGYDNYSMKPYLIGLCYDFQTGYDINPDPNDVRMNLIVTENGVYYGERIF
ncbi:MAG: 5-formyltetrahydrofolate cyclo-ligase [Lachnospiraceae bacterium]|nr:5-formyltetrahydrofolate cyclo-ligase [Lachnospiraceae bacterium]